MFQILDMPTQDDWDTITLVEDDINGLNTIALWLVDTNSTTGGNKRRTK